MKWPFVSRRRFELSELEVSRWSDAVLRRDLQLSEARRRALEAECALRAAEQELRALRRRGAPIQHNGEIPL